MLNKKILAKITLIGKDTLKFECLSDKPVRDKIYPPGNGRIGTVVLNSIKNLGIEKKALPVLKKLFDDAECDGGDMGDIDWFRSDNGKGNFAWLGDPVRIFKLKDETYKARGNYYMDALHNGEFVQL